MSTAIVLMEVGVTVLGKPKDMLKQAQEVAEVLIDVVKKQELSQKIGNREHIYVTAWQFLAHFYGVSAKGTELIPYVDELTGAAGFKATADAILIATGMVISSGQAMWLNNDDNWSTRPK